MGTETQMTPQTIIHDTAAIYGVTVEELTSPCRRRELADARAVVSFILTTHGMGISETARLLHKRHASVIYHARRAAEWLERPILNRRAYDTIQTLLKRYYNDTGTNRGGNTPKRGRRTASQRVERMAGEKAHALVS